MLSIESTIVLIFKIKVDNNLDLNEFQNLQSFNVTKFVFINIWITVHD